MVLESEPGAGQSEKKKRINSGNEETFSSFLVIKRDVGDFSKVSPFLISKLINNVAGDTKMIKKTKDGSLIETKASYQSQKLLSVKALGEFSVSVSAHSTLNTSKGVLFCRDLMNCHVDGILVELKEQGDYDVRRIISKMNG